MLFVNIIIHIIPFLPYSELCQIHNNFNKSQYFQGKTHIPTKYQIMENASPKSHKSLDFSMISPNKH